MPFSLEYIKEIKRKSVHLSSVWIPSLYYFLAKEQMLLLLGGITVFVVVTDILRHFSLYFANLFYGLFGSMLRPHELEPGRIRLTGASYVLIGALATVFLFPKLIAITALSVLVVSDCFAALIGKHYGKTPLIDGKTREGTLAFIVSGWITVVIVGILFKVSLSYFIVACFAVCIGAVVELYAKKCHIDDNLTIPLSVAAAMWAIFSLIG